MTGAICRFVSLALLVGATTFAQQASMVPAKLKPAPPEIEELIKQAIGDTFAAKKIPDQGLPGRSTRIAIRQEMPGSGMILSPASSKADWLRFLPYLRRTHSG